MALVLAVSGVLSGLTTVVLQPGGGPDEIDHYSYVQHLAREPLPFPPRYEDIRVGPDAVPSHLVHPPLYHHLLAGVYRFLDVDRQLTSVGREADRHGAVSAPVVIPALRVASLALVVLHLVGLFLLLRYLVGRSIVPAWASVPLAAASSWVPSTIFISGTVNNDVLVRAIWPWLTLAAVRFAVERRPEDAWLGLLLVSVGVLTKVTFWPLALSATAAYGVVMALAWRTSGSPMRALRGGGMTRSRVWRTRSLALAGALAAAAVVWYFVGMAVRYGSPRARYTTVFGLSPEESKFYRESVAEADLGGIGDFVTVASDAFQDVLTSFFGILGQFERIRPDSVRAAGIFLLVLAAISLVLATWGLVSRHRDAPSVIGAALIGAAIVFLVIYTSRLWSSYQATGNYGTQGRYLIGYIDLWLIGTLILAVRFVRTRVDVVARLTSGTAAVGALIGVLLLFCAPGYYFARTLELHQRTGVGDLVASEAEQRGFTAVELAPLSGDAHRVATRRSGRLLPAALSLSGGSAIIGGPVPDEASDAPCLDVLLHTRSEQSTTVVVGILTGVPDGLETRDRHSGDTMAVPERVEVIRGTVTAEPSGDEAMMWIGPAQGASMPIDILQAFARPTTC